MLDVPETTPVAVRAGHAVRLFAQGVAEPIVTVVTRVSERIDPSTRTYEVRCRVDDPSGAVKAGSYARAEIVAVRETPRPVAPRSALVTRDGRAYVLRVEGGIARDVPVRVGIDDRHAHRARSRASRRATWSCTAKPRRGSSTARASEPPRPPRMPRSHERGHAVNIADISISRPVFAAMLNLGLVVLGLISLSRLELKLDPDIDFPFATVVTELRGASPETVEREVTERARGADQLDRGHAGRSAPLPSRVSRRFTSSSARLRRST